MPIETSHLRSRLALSAVAVTVNCLVTLERSIVAIKDDFQLLKLLELTLVSRFLARCELLRDLKPCASCHKEILIKDWTSEELVDGQHP